MAREYTKQDLLIFLAIGATILIIGWTFLGNQPFLTSSHMESGSEVYEWFYLQNYQYQVVDIDLTISYLYSDSIFLALTGEFEMIWFFLFFDGFFYLGMGIVLTLLLGAQMWYRFIDRTSPVPISVRSLLIAQLINFLLPPILFFFLFLTMPADLNPSGALTIDMLTYILHLGAGIFLGYGIFNEFKSPS